MHLNIFFLIPSCNGLVTVVKVSCVRTTACLNVRHRASSWRSPYLTLRKFKIRRIRAIFVRSNAKCYFVENNRKSRADQGSDSYRMKRENVDLIEKTVWKWWNADVFGTFASQKPDDLYCSPFYFQGTVSEVVSSFIWYNSFSTKSLTPGARNRDSENHSSQTVS